MVASPKAFISSMTGVHHSGRSVSIPFGVVDWEAPCGVLTRSFVCEASVEASSVVTSVLSASASSVMPVSPVGSAACLVRVPCLRSKANDSVSGGRHDSSLQAMNSTSPTNLNAFGSVTRIFCVNVTVPEYHRNSRPGYDASSRVTVGFTEAVGLPTNSAPFSFSYLMEVEIGPPLGRFMS